MSNLLVVTVSLLVSLTSASLCNFTGLLGTHGNGGSYFSSQRNNSCYVFALKEFSVTKAQNFCRTIGGQLTDVKSRKGNYLQELIDTESINYTGIKTEYWIGLLWNDYLGAFYWDTGAVQNLYVRNPWTCWWPWPCPCVAMTSSDLNGYKCEKEKSFICQLDLGCQGQEVTNDSVCTRCRDYIQGHLNTPMMPSWNGTTAGSEAAVNTTDYDNGTRHSNQNKVGTECRTCQADNKMVLMILAGVGAFTVVLLVAVLVLCALIVKYRRLLGDKDTPNRISMVDILHADSPFAARGKRPSDHSGSHPGSTSELLYNNPYNTYSTPESDGGQAAGASDVFYQENGYSEASERSPSGNEVRFEPQLDSAGSKYTQLNRAGDQMDQQHSHHVYGIESASEPQTETRKISNTYESYTNQH